MVTGEAMGRERVGKVTCLVTRDLLNKSEELQSSCSTNVKSYLSASAA